MIPLEAVVAHRDAVAALDTVDIIKALAGLQQRFHGDNSQLPWVSLTSRRRIGSIEKAPLPGLFP